MNLIDKYGLPEFEIGRGTYAVVSKHGKYAVKRFYGTDEIECSTLREIAIVNFLRHSNIISWCDIFIKGVEVSVVMELAEHTLDQHLQYNDNSISKKQIYQLIGAVAYLHSMGVIHRDIKPMNILIYPSGIKLADFGISRLSSFTSDSGLTKEVTTIYYRAPEIFMEERYDHRADIWSLGCVIAEIYLRRPIFKSTEEDVILDLFWREFGDYTSIFDKLTNPQLYGKKWEKIKKQLLTRSTYEPILTDLPIVHYFLQMDQTKRWTLQNIMKDSYFSDCFDDDIPPLLSLREQVLKNDRPLPNNFRSSKTDYSHLNSIFRDIAYHRGVVSISSIMLAFHLFELLWYKGPLDLFGEDDELIGCVCLYIASKFKDVAHPDYEYFRSHGYKVSAKGLINTEARILKELNFDLCHITSADYLFSSQASIEKMNMAKYILPTIHIANLHLPLNKEKEAESALDQLPKL